MLGWDSFSSRKISKGTSPVEEEGLDSIRRTQINI